MITLRIARVGLNGDFRRGLGLGRLRRRRRLLGLTQQQLAGACGVRFQQIQKYECGANRISAARLWQLAEVLEVPISYFNTNSIISFCTFQSFASLSIAVASISVT